MTLIRRQDENNYLSLERLNYGLEVESVAFLESAVLRYTNPTHGGKPYIAFYFREASGNRMRGWMWDIKDVNDVGFDMPSLRRRAVSVRYKLTVRQGTVELDVRGVKAWDGKFDFEAFLGTVPNSKENFEKTNKMLEQELETSSRVFPIEMGTMSLLEVCEGRAGGFASLVYGVVRDLISYQQAPNMNSKLMFSVASRTLNFYADYLHTTELLEIRLSNLVIDLINKHNVGGDENIKNITMDACLALAGMGKPQHLYSHMLVSSVQTRMRNLTLAYQYATMVNGSVRTWGDGECLTKY